VRHEKGASPFFPHIQAEQESVNSANGNLSFAVPLLSRPGRGMVIDLKLTYNSKIWDFFVQGSTLYATLPEYDSWVGPGWTFTMGRIIDDSANGYYYLTTSDGSNHTLANYGGAWRSMDSTYMIYDPVARKLTLKNGVNLSFAYQDPARPYIWYATRMQDTNGNYVDIAYSGTGGRISYIYDTLGNTYTFLLNSGGGLQYIRYWNTNDTTQATSTISFGYEPLWPSFGSQATTDPLIGTQQMLSEVTYLSGVRYSFLYNSSGQVAEITYPTLGKSRYFYSIYTVYDRLLSRTVPDFYVSSHDTGAGTPTWTWSNNPSGNVAPSTVSIAIPGKSTLAHYMQKSSSGWAAGFVTKIAYYDSTLSKRTLQDWTQDDEQLVTIKNPRPSWISTGRKQGTNEFMVRSEFSYAPTSEYSGNVKEIREYSSDQVTLRRRTTLSYLHESNGSYANLNILDRVTSSQIYGSSNNLVSKSVTAYDSFTPLYSAPNAIRHDSAFGTTYVLRGLPTSVTRWHNIAQNGSVTASTKYDECGNVRQTVDPLGHTTLTEYWLSTADNAYAFPLRATNAKGHVNLATYSYKSGAAKTKTNANGLVTTLTYDNYDRVTQSTDTDGAMSTITYVEDPWYVFPPYALINKYMAQGQPIQQRVTLDNMGRLSETTVLGNIKQKQTYDTTGSVETRSLPYIDGQTRSWITYSNGGVATQSVTYSNSATITYNNGLQNVRVEGNNGQKKEYYYYDSGRISGVMEQDPATGQLTIPTYYGYDDLDRLTIIIQGVQTRSFTYDGMGRLLTETLPESGTTSYVYDNNSNVVLKTDSRGVVTSYSYDELNRITLKTYSDGTPEVNYSYDVQPADSPISITNPVGKLTKIMTTSSGVTAKNFYSYCSCSSVNQESTVIIDGTTKIYTTSYTHNLAGQLTSITYPDGRVVNYTRDSQGRETKVSSTVSGQAFDYVYGATYGGPQGQLTEVQYSNWSVGLKTMYTYYPTAGQLAGHLQQMEHISNLSYPNLNLRWDFSYSAYHPTPQISDISDYWNPAQNEHYEYDRLDRLTSWWISQCRQDPPSRKMDVSYDRYGNIVGIVDGTTPYAFNVDPATNRLLSRMGSGGQTTFSYDNAGNATSYGPFDAENRLRSRAGTNYLYDGNGRRFRKQGSSTINYIYSHSGMLLQEDNVTTAAKDDFIYFNGENVVVHGQNPATYKLMLRDFHGSVRKSALVTINPPYMSLSLCEQYTYDPWGQIISSIQSNPPYTDFKYQNKERDGGLDYFGARYHDGSSPSSTSPMRWISTDPVTADIYDPQSLNKYTYVRNDPVNLVDPDGRQAALPRDEVAQYRGIEGSYTVYGWIHIGGEGGYWDYTSLYTREVNNSSPGSSGGVGGLNISPGISGTSLPKWILRLIFNVNTKISETQRRNTLQTALNGLNARLSRGNCESFLMNLINIKNKDGARIYGNSIASINDLITQGLNKSEVWLYGAVHDSGNLGTGRNHGFAASGKDTIYLGEKFYVQGGPTGADGTTTIIHEMLQLGLVSANGEHISDITLDSLFGSGAAGGFRDAVTTNCGKSQ
jgi:RHS repeat-associated protein